MTDSISSRNLNLVVDYRTAAPILHVSYDNRELVGFSPFFDGEDLMNSDAGNRDTSMSHLTEIISLNVNLTITRRVIYVMGRNHVHLQQIVSCRDDCIMTHAREVRFSTLVAHLQNYGNDGG